MDDAKVAQIVARVMIDLYGSAAVQLAEHQLKVADTDGRSRWASIVDVITDEMTVSVSAPSR